MKLSVIILCYNFENYIEQCILSVVAQKTNFEFEIIIGDDFSTDKSVENIERLLFLYPNIKLYINSENLGMTKNYLSLLKIAQGEYIAHIDGDDYWIDVNKLQKQVDFLEENKDFILVFTGYIQKENNNYSPGLGYWFCCPFTHEITTTDLLQLNYVTYGKLWRNNQDYLKPYMEELPFIDWPINYELSKLGRIAYFDYPSGIYRIGSGTYSVDIDKHIKNDQVRNKINEIHNNI